MIHMKNKPFILRTHIIRFTKTNSKCWLSSSKVKVVYFFQKIIITKDKISGHKDYSIVWMHRRDARIEIEHFKTNSSLKKSNKTKMATMVSINCQILGDVFLPVSLIINLLISSPFLTSPR